MKTSHCIPALALAFSSCVTTSTVPPVRTELVIVGGGGTTPPIVARALELARGRESYVVVLPQASESEQRGVESTQMWKDAGASEAVNLDDLSDRERALAELERADLIWFGGGDQKLLMEALRQADLIETISRRASRGVVCGGTSAGAAVMSAVMITGEGTDKGTDELKKIAAGATLVSQGLGLLPGAIVDQHFLARQRNNRLLGAVLDHPELIGVGIDERTAFIVVDGRAEVLGEGGVVVYDARRAAVERSEPGQRSAARGIEMHVLRSGMVYELGD
ncbi:MAG: cyanophycinase [Planctomycetes bacterium]|nr:cyanophycinase [Planctomycetota bacterium]